MKLIKGHVYKLNDTFNGSIYILRYIGTAKHEKTLFSFQVLKTTDKKIEKKYHGYMDKKYKDDLIEITTDKELVLEML